MSIAEKQSFVKENYNHTAASIPNEEITTHSCGLSYNPSLANIESTIERIKENWMCQMMHPYKYRIRQIQKELLDLKSRIKTSFPLNDKVRLDCLSLKNKIINLDYTFRPSKQELALAQELLKKCLGLLSMEKKSDDYKKALQEVEAFILANKISVNSLDYRDPLTLFLSTGEHIHKKNYSFVYRCFIEGHFDLVKLLATCGVDVTVFARMKPIHDSSNASQEQMECIKTLIDSGLEPKVLLAKLSNAEQLRMINALISIGLDPNSALDNLICADISYPLEILQSFIDAGAKSDRHMAHSLFYRAHSLEMMGRLRLLIYNGVSINVHELETRMSEERRLYFQSAKSSSSLQHNLQKSSRDFPILYESLQIREIVLQAMSRKISQQFQEELSQVEAFSKGNPLEVRNIVRDYCLTSLTAEDVIEDPVLRKRLLEGCRKQKDYVTAMVRCD